MTPADIDPSLCAAEPLLDTLEDGFSPPAQPQAQQQDEAKPPAEPQPLGAKSPF
ncbi:MAG TPA: hypothetical protein VEB23_08945 [Ramlibacter sp.]|nr:hypothetical protein [Ramlibacter sp.]